MQLDSTIQPAVPSQRNWIARAVLAISLMCAAGASQAAQQFDLSAVAGSTVYGTGFITFDNVPADCHNCLMPNFEVTAFNWTWTIAPTGLPLPEPYGLASLLESNSRIDIYSDSTATVLGFAFQAAPPIEAVESAIQGGPVVFFTDLETYSGYPFGTTDGTAIVFPVRPCPFLSCELVAGTWSIDGDEVSSLTLKVSPHVPAPVPLPATLPLLTAALAITGFGARVRT